jgi:cytochrome c oxidase cbb3-type subunit III
MMKLCSIKPAWLLAATFLLFHQAGLFAQEHAANGPQLFASTCGACHGSDGRSGERAPNIATRREVVALTDADLIRIVQHGIAGTGMPAFGYLGDEKIKAIVAHLRTLQGVGAAVHLPGDPVQGESIFFGRAACGNCHMVNGRGGFVAEDLSGYGSGHSADDLRASILHPGRKQEREASAVTIVMKDGSRLAGMIRSQDNFSIVLQDSDGGFHLASRSKVLRTEPDKTLMMPDDYESRLSSKDLDDLLRYLLKPGANDK